MAQQPAPDSINLVRIIMDDEQEPLVGYLALIVGSVAEHNYAAAAAAIEEMLGQFEAAGAGELLADLELRLRAVFEPFFNVEDQDGH